MEIPVDMTVAVISKLLDIWFRTISSCSPDGLKRLLSGIKCDKLVDQILPLFLNLLDRSFLTKTLRGYWSILFCSCTTHSCDFFFIFLFLSIGVVEIVSIINLISQESLVILLSHVIDPNKNTTLAAWCGNTFHAMNINKSATVALFPDASKVVVVLFFVLLIIYFLDINFYFYLIFKGGHISTICFSSRIKNSISTSFLFFGSKRTRSNGVDG
jgi:hypothetical protein